MHFDRKEVAVSRRNEKQEKDALYSAFWACVGDAGITSKETERRDQVRGAEGRLILGVRKSLARHVRKLRVRYGTSNVRQLRVTHPNCRTVRAALRAALKDAGVPAAYEADYQKFVGVERRLIDGKHGPLAKHRANLLRLFGTADLELARSIHERRPRLHLAYEEASAVA